MSRCSDWASSNARLNAAPAGAGGGHDARIAELVAVSDVPVLFRGITSLYLETYATRISQVYVTLLAWFMTIVFFGAALLLAVVIPIHAQDALTFGKCSNQPEEEDSPDRWQPIAVQPQASCYADGRRHQDACPDCRAKVAAN